MVESDEASVFVCDPEFRTDVNRSALSRVYGLTRSEAALVTMLVSGNTLEQAADQLFISIHTARTRLKRILLKTDTGRQAELLRTMLLGAAQLALD